MINLRNLHLLIGILGIVVFLLTDQYMDRFHDHLRGMPDGPRLFYRSAHIYLLWSSLLNLVIGSYLVERTIKWARRVQFVGSILVQTGPFLLIYSFFFETHNENLTREVAKIAIFASAGGVILLALFSKMGSDRHD